MTEKSKTGIKSDKSGTEEDLEQLFGTPLSDTDQDSHDAGDAAHGESSAQNAPEDPPQIDSFESLEDFVNSAPEQTEQPQSSEFPTTDFSASTTEGENFPSFTNPGANPAVDSLADPIPDPPFNPDLGVASESASEVLPKASSSTTLPASALSDASTETSSPTSKPATLDSIKNYSESVTTNQTVVAASFPFTLKIDGHLTPQEAEKLIDVINRENMGFREVDLEPQLAEGKILIPRISEYAGIVLIQALRGVQAKITFAASELFEGDSEVSSEVRPESVFTKSEAPSHATGESAELLPVTQGEELPQLGVYEVSDTLIVSGILSTRSLESSSSPEYTALLEALMRELKFKAYRRKARGITMLKIQVAPLTLPTDHRITISGTLVV